MAKFLNSSATAFHLEQLIKYARERLVLVTPFLKFSGRAKELLAEKTGLDVRVVYGKNDLQPDEINWLRGLAPVRTHFARSLSAKCYLNEEQCIVTSLDLFDFGQVSNHEMGVLISRAEDAELYQEVCDEAERIVRVSDEVRVSVEKVERPAAAPLDGVPITTSAGKLSTHRLAKKLGLRTQELLDGLQRLGAIEVAAGHKQLTAHGTRLGGEIRRSARFGNHFVWPENFELAELAVQDS
ncbi:MAG: DNA repair protein [Verrucomicrobiota bacterium]|nr:DNA repair protein [Verrucomicrobiota bacterium]